MSLFLRIPSTHPLPNLIHSLKSPTIPLFLTFHPQTHNFLCFNKGCNPNKPNKISDAELASDLASEINKLNTQSKERENAMKTSKQLLFTDLCKYLDMNPDDVINKWTNMTSDDKLGLVKGFVSDWGLNFHPLSPKSVKDLVEEFVLKDSKEIQSCNLVQKAAATDDSGTSDFDVILPTLKKLIMGFTREN